MNSIPDQITSSVKPEVTGFFDEPTNTITYVVKDPASAACAVIDCVMDIDYPAGRISHESADAVIAYIRDHSLRLGSCQSTGQLRFAVRSFTCRPRTPSAMRLSQRPHWRSE